MTDKKMAEAALEARWVTMEQLQAVIPAGRREGKPFSLMLREMGLDEEQITFLQACALELPYARVDKMRVSHEAHKALPRDLQKRYRVAALRIAADDSVYVAMLPEAAAELSRYVKEATGAKIRPVAASAGAIQTLLRRFENGEAGDDFAPAAEHYDFDTPAQARSRGVPALVSPVEPTTETEPLITSLADF